MKHNVSDLKPCPFCGGEAKVKKAPWDRSEEGSSVCEVYCTECHASIYGETFKIPEAYIPKIGARIMGLQNPTSKMSKSAEDPNDKILLSDEPDVIRKKLKKAVTDSDNCVKFDVQNKPGVSNLMSIYGIIENNLSTEINYR